MAVNDEKAVRAIEKRLTETDQSRAKSLEKERKKLNKRLAELDRLFSSLYEDKVMERITERNFEMMSGKYQKEQLEIEARLKEVTETLNDSYEKSQGVRDFLALNPQLSRPKRIGRNRYKRTHRQDTCFGA